MNKDDIEKSDEYGGSFFFIIAEQKIKIVMNQSDVFLCGEN